MSPDPVALRVAYTRAAVDWIEILDHRCVDPARVGAALRQCVDPAATCDGDVHALLREVYRHPEETGPDTMVLSDAVLHVLGADADPLDLLAALAATDPLVRDVRPSTATVRAADSIFYTPEARSDLEGRAQLNLARIRPHEH